MPKNFVRQCSTATLFLSCFCLIFQEKEEEREDGNEKKTKETIYFYGKGLHHKISIVPRVQYTQFLFFNEARDIKRGAKKRKAKGKEEK